MTSLRDQPPGGNSNRRILLCGFASSARRADAARLDDAQPMEEKDGFREAPRTSASRW
jgi:hypothetical protein